MKARHNAAHHAPAQMTREYNRVMAFSKIDTAPIAKLDDRMIESISRTHKVPVEVLRARLVEREARELANG